MVEYHESLIKVLNALFRSSTKWLHEYAKSQFMTPRGVWVEGWPTGEHRQSRTDTISK